MSIPCNKTFLLAPSSRSSIKVEYKGHNLKKKKAVKGAFMIRLSQTNLVMYYFAGEPSSSLLHDALIKQERADTPDSIGSYECMTLG